MDDIRANPDELLKRINEEAQAQTQGRLKIFFGYAAGVGKTYAMLEAAHAAKDRGVDVVVGYVEPHTRPQTTKLLEGLETLPPIPVSYNGITLNEFNLDGSIERAPQLILVDELAHTNAKGSRHSKRYKDIGELLKAGIDVYTTVNVQHIESLNDMVASITGVMVRERIPDHVFENADQVELVDIEPEDLIQRLNAGNIYKEEQAQKALSNFFSVENLIALREIALRSCANRVNKISEKARLAQGSDYYTDEHILVCLSASPTNPKIIRTTARMASAFRGTFTALFVETPESASMSDEDKNRLRSNIHLAEQLGAKIETVYGDDVAIQIAEFARLSGVSKIVVGRNNAKKRRLFRKASLVEQLTSIAPNLDIYIIPDKFASPYKARGEKQPILKNVVMDTAKSLFMLFIATAVGFLFRAEGFSEANIITFYILSVLVTAVATSHRIFSLVSSVISVLVFNYFFTEPRFSLDAYDSGYPATFIIMFLAAFITSTLAVRIKQHAKQSAAMAYRTKILLETNQTLQQEKEKNGIISVTAKQLTKLLKRDIVFYCVENSALAEPEFFPADENVVSRKYATDNEKAVASWVYKNNKRAGATTATLGSAEHLYLAVRVNQTVYGVVGIAVSPQQPLDSFENSIVLSIMGECALALENHKAAQEREEAAVLAKNEQLRANLLRSISHDLRTPLTSISGNAGILLSNDGTIEPTKRNQLITDIYDDSLWLINLVENLLSVTRIEEGTMRLNMSAELMDEVIEEALRHINRNSSEHKITVKQDVDFLMAKMDARLIVQVVINIVDNAIKYTQAGSQITIETTKKSQNINVQIKDDGQGIDDEGKEKVFDMFYTASTKIADSRRGLGLGLALCKSIISAHGGEISVRDNEPTGTIFEFSLPAEEVTLRE